MKNCHVFFLKTALSIFASLYLSQQAFADLNVDLRRTVIVSTLSESIVSVASQIEEQTGKRVHDLTWSAEFSDKTWNVFAKGKANDDDISFEISGNVDGNNGNDLRSGFGGKGAVGNVSFDLDGNANWIFNTKRRDYHSTKFQQVMRFSQDAHWKWIVGGEILVGGAVAGGAIVMTAPLGPIAWLAIGKEAVDGAAALVSVSSVAIAMQKPSDPPPSVISIDEAKILKKPLKPTKGKIYVSLERNGKITATSPNGSTVMTGTFYNVDFGGKAEGTLK